MASYLAMNIDSTCAEENPCACFLVAEGESVQACF